MRQKIEQAGIIVKPHAPNIEEIVSELVDYLEKKSIHCLLEDVAARKIHRGDGLPREEVPARADLVIVLGGDGTLLSIAHLAALENVPVLGVNLGRLGFLTEVPIDEIYMTLESLLAGDERIISPRRMLEAKCRGKQYYCLNDVVINKGALARMIQIGLWIDGKEIAALKADGFIISTPTGSTGYSLSAGGPILQPFIPALILSPICPHTLSFRPMVVSLDSTVSIQLLTAGEEVYLTLDGQRGVLIGRNDVVEVRRADCELHLVSSPQRNFFDLLKEKLGWAAFS
jgi:NAD+ kinase